MKKRTNKLQVKAEKFLLKNPEIKKALDLFNVSEKSYNDALNSFNKTEVKVNYTTTASNG